MDARVKLGNDEGKNVSSWPELALSVAPPKGND